MFATTDMMTKDAHVRIFGSGVVRVTHTVALAWRYGKWSALWALFCAIGVSELLFFFLVLPDIQLVKCRLFFFKLYGGVGKIHNASS